MDEHMLRSKMTLFGDTSLSLAEALNLHRNTMSKKLSSECEFTQSEIAFIKKRYNLTDEEVSKIFLEVKT